MKHPSPRWPSPTLSSMTKRAETIAEIREYLVELEEIAGHLREFIDDHTGSYKDLVDHIGGDISHHVGSSALLLHRLGHVMESEINRISTSN